MPSGGGRAAALVTAGIALSRLVGLVRQRVTAYYFGLSVDADVLAAAFRIGNVAQNLLGEGALSATFIPVYARLKGEGKPLEAAAFARAVFGALLLLAGSVSLLGAVLAGPLTRILVLGFDPALFPQATAVVRVVFPMTGLLVLGAFGLGVLTAERRFFLPYAAPVLWSAAQIAALVVSGTILGRQGAALAMDVAWGAVVGAVLQLVVLLPVVRRYVGSLRPRFDASDPPLREAAGRFPSVLVGRGVLQLSGLVDMTLVSFLGVGANASFNHAQTLYLLPMSLLGTGEAAASLPELAELRGDPTAVARMRERLGASLRRVLAVAIPAALALGVLGRSVVGLVLQSGGFDVEATRRVASILAVYAVALVPNAVGRIFATGCYAFGDTAGPARFSLVRVAVSTAGSLVAMRWFGVEGVVAGAVLAAWIETTLLARRLRGHLGALPDLGRPAALGFGLGAAALAPALVVVFVAPPSRIAAAGALGAFGLAFLAAAARFGLVPRFGRR